MILKTYLHLYSQDMPVSLFSRPTCTSILKTYLYLYSQHLPVSPPSCGTAYAPRPPLPPSLPRSLHQSSQPHNQHCHGAVCCCLRGESPCHHLELTACWTHPHLAMVQRHNLQRPAQLLSQETCHLQLAMQKVTWNLWVPM